MRIRSWVMYVQMLNKYFNSNSKRMKLGPISPLLGGGIGPNKLQFIRNNNKDHLPLKFSGAFEYDGDDGH